MQGMHRRHGMPGMAGMSEMQGMSLKGLPGMKSGGQQPGSGGQQQVPLKVGSATKVPNISSSNPDNFLTLYSKKL